MTCGETTGDAENCNLGTEFTYVDQNGNDTNQCPTCRQGANFYRVCSDCGGKKQDSFGKLPHKYNKDNTELVTQTKEATCTEAGEIEVKCESCKIYTKKFSIPALGHNIVDKDLAEGESVHCDRCGENIAPADFNYDNNEFDIYKSGKYYYKGRVKTLTGNNSYTNEPIYETSEMTLAIDPGQSVYMMMPFDGSTEIGYLAYKEKNLLGKTETKKYFETFSESENKRYYFQLDDSMIDLMTDGDESMNFPSPDDDEFKVTTNFDLKNDTEKAQVVYQGNVCSRFTYKNGKTTYRVYMNGQKLLLIETLNENDVVTSATYFDSITADIPKYMTTTEKQGSVLTGMVGLMKFAGYIGVLD